MSLACGSEIYGHCEGLTVNMDIAGFKLVAGEIVSTGTFAITIAFATMGQSLSKNQRKGMNAIRCAFVSGFFNVWMVMASVYYASLEFGFAADLEEMYNDFYPYLCTCTDEVNDWATKLGASKEDAKDFDSCSDQTGGSS